ncbi:SDR family NAD(P)-dependent oxidoreductase [Streptomyces sp. NPDC060184]|uniref:SDR family NAD(P)-dependent oxidoreductase n=1 Tax=Streptomyces sp. NPDC060184 TaxID=3347064 RepID=UPI0036633FC4
MSPVAVVSGGSRGLGRLVAERLLSDGWQVATFSRSPSDFTEERQKTSPDAFLWEAVDLADHAALRRFVARVRTTFGRVDLLVNNAALLDGQELFLTSRPERIEASIAGNLTGPIILTQACAKVMSAQRGGHILTVSSINAVRGYRGVAVYSATKAALDGFTRSLARELGPLNIRVNSLAPGYFESALTSDVTDLNRERIKKRTPLGRLADPQEIADAIAFLVSSRSSFITGQTLIVDGGITC